MYIFFGKAFILNNKATFLLPQYRLADRAIWKYKINKLTHAYPTSIIHRPACLHTLLNISYPISFHTLLVDVNANQSCGVQYDDVACNASIGNVCNGIDEWLFVV